MITCLNGSDPKTTAIVRGCTVIIIAIIVALCLVAFIALAIAGTVNAAPIEQTCAPIAFVRVIAPLSANVRGGPSSTEFEPVANALKFEDGEKVACEQSGVWYRLDGLTPKGAQQWVSATYNNGRNDLLTVRQAAPTSTPMPTVAPTIAPTPTKVGTPQAGRWVRVKQSAWHFCPDVSVVCDVPVELEYRTSVP